MSRQHLWKCQKCGLTFHRSSPGEPRRCPMCLDRGSKSYRGLKQEEKAKAPKT